MIKRIADRAEESDDKKPDDKLASSEPAQGKEPEPCFHRSSAILLAHRGVKPRELVVAKSSVTKRAPLVAAEETVTTSRVTGRSGPQMCPVCKKIISSASNLRQHYTICHTSSERPYACDTCQKRFNTESNLRQHRRTHTGERPFRVRIVTVPSTSSNLRQHLRIHTGERPFACPECGKRFGSSANLRQHRKTHDNHRSSKKEESEDEAPRPDTVILVEMEEPNEMIVGYQSVADGTA
ncbi:hypothetical protein MTO96_011406 [Rhipicephalus appendiculatus]